MALEADSWLCNFIFSNILKTHVFLKTYEEEIEVKIEFLLPFTRSRKVSYIIGFVMNTKSKLKLIQTPIQNQEKNTQSKTENSITGVKIDVGHQIFPT